MPNKNYTRPSRRYSTHKQDFEFLRSRIQDATREWKVGDACLSYNMQSQTTVKEINGDVITLANGDALHRSKMHSVKE